MDLNEQFKRQNEQIIDKYERKNKRLEKELKAKGNRDHSSLISSSQNIKLDGFILSARKILSTQFVCMYDIKYCILRSWKTVYFLLS
jgi:predicted DNA-binding helix-hairpin-helix protein